MILLYDGNKIIDGHTRTFWPHFPVPSCCVSPLRRNQHKESCTKVSEIPKHDILHKDTVLSMSQAQDKDSLVLSRPCRAIAPSRPIQTDKVMSVGNGNECLVLLTELKR